MVEQDKNHPSIIMWSRGNESGTGGNPRQWRHGRGTATDPARCTTRATSPVRTSTSTARMYASPAEVDAIGRGDEPPLADPVLDARRRTIPFVLCEYARHGERSGGLTDYQELFERHARCQRRLRVEWIDQRDPARSRRTASVLRLRRATSGRRSRRRQLRHRRPAVPPTAPPHRECWSSRRSSSRSGSPVTRRPHSAHRQPARLPLPVAPALLLDAGARRHAEGRSTLGWVGAPRRRSCRPVAAAASEPGRGVADDPSGAGRGRVLGTSRSRKVAWGQVQVSPSPLLRPLRWTAGPLVHPDLIRVGCADFDPVSGRLQRLGDLELDGPRLDVWRAPTDKRQGPPDEGGLAAGWRAWGFTACSTAPSRIQTTADAWSSPPASHPQAPISGCWRGTGGRRRRRAGADPRRRTGRRLAPSRCHGSASGSACPATSGWSRWFRVRPGRGPIPTPVGPPGSVGS